MLELAGQWPGWSECAVDVVKDPESGGGSPTKPAGSGWLVLTLAGAAAFWFANLLISWTPAAAAYRTALSIEYLPMLVQAAVGGLVIAGIVAAALVRFPGRMPGSGPLSKALVLAAGALLVVTVLLEVPSKLSSGVEDPGHWLVVATVFNAIRVLALGFAMGLIARARDTRSDRHPLVRK